ncbi:hypothetical protein [Marinobacter sp.]|uniref:hypothetical protein n=1 Tax=Marinobacter sp. TaxID=50741 RepID=UPI0025BE86D3|nr:hypothetical protein [Marinobacter sp.]
MTDNKTPRQKIFHSGGRGRWLDGRCRQSPEFLQPKADYFEGGSGYFAHEGKQIGAEGPALHRAVIARFSPRTVLQVGCIQKEVPEWVEEVLGLMKQLAAERQTMMVVNHEVANRVILIDGGRIVEQGPPSEIFYSPRDPRTKDFLTKILATNPV